MQDGTYPSRDFATLGPSGLRPPFTGTYKLASQTFFILQHWAGVRLYTSYFYFAKSYVFNKQSLPPLRSCSFQLSLSRSYWEILPSSFSIIHSFACIYSISRPVLVFVRLFVNFFLEIRCANPNPQVYRVVSRTLTCITHDYGQTLSDRIFHSQIIFTMEPCRHTAYFFFKSSLLLMLAYLLFISPKYFTIFLLRVKIHSTTCINNSASV